MESRLFHGAWPALLTPATDDGGVNPVVLGQLTDTLLERGIGGLYLCGSTGEGVFLSVPERQTVVEVVMARVAGRVPVIVHVGAVATRHAVTLASHARDLGVDGVASILPPFGRGVDETLVHYETIAAAVPDVGFYPYLFGGETDAITLMRDLKARIPNLAGAKYTGPDMYEFQAIVELGEGRWTVFSGMDQQCVFAAMFGATANIGSTLNLMPGLYREIHESCRAGDFARARDLQLQANGVTRVLQRFGIFGALFEALRILGFECGAPRLPRTALPPEAREAFHRALTAANFPELAAM